MEICSSTGKLGTSKRSYDRLYSNSRRHFSDLAEVKAEIGRITEIAKQCPHLITRSVFRASVNDEVIQHIANNGIHSSLEVALPIKEFTNDNSWLIYIAKNEPERKQIVPHEIMIKETNIQKKENVSPVEKVQSITQQGYTFANHICEDQVDQVHVLWGETFGWRHYEIDNLRKRLITDNNNPSSQKSVWFSAVKDNDTIISAAMAERLTIPSAQGKLLDLVESTEWRTRDKYTGNGLMTATLAVLNAQILSDLQDSPKGLPLIYAECNFQSRSDRAGHGAGFRIPERTYAPQHLVQNVFVRDGQPISEDKLRDFTFMYLPVETIRNHYNPAQINSITQMLKS